MCIQFRRTPYTATTLFSIGGRACNTTGIHYVVYGTCMYIVCVLYVLLVCCMCTYTASGLDVCSHRSTIIPSAVQSTALPTNKVLLQL